MKRREFMEFLGGAAAVASSPGRAQQPAKSHRIGILETVSPSLNANNLEALRRGLRELGYIEKQNYILEYRSADGDAGRFLALADELVRLGVDLIVTRGTPAARPQRMRPRRSRSSWPQSESPSAWVSLPLWRGQGAT
jgi:putative ABC transport system substrate-binding protein